MTHPSSPAPVAPGPLPERAATLDFIPLAKRANYGRRQDGVGWQLLYIHESDAAERAAHLEAIAKGRLTVYPDDVTPASLAAQDRAAKDAEAEVWRLVAAQEAKDRAGQMAALEARQAKERARHAAELDRLRASHRR